jgi:hypothetical protein
MAEDRVARRQAAVFVALITIAVFIAPFAPEGLGAIVLLLVFLAALFGRRRRTYFRQVVARYHASPFARLCDCLFGLARHTWHRRIVDALLSLVFVITVAGPILLLELVIKKSPQVDGTVGIGLACGVVVWHTVLEIFHEPRRHAEYAGLPQPKALPVWPLLLILLVEAGTFVVLRAADYFPEYDFLRGFLLGVVAMGLADAATLQSTLVAGLLHGRPLR